MATIKVSGMTCQHCVQAVAKAISQVAGVRNVRVDLEKGEAKFDEDGVVDLVQVKEKVREAGYEAD